MRLAVRRQEQSLSSLFRPYTRSLMDSRTARLIGAAAVLLIGLFALRRAANSEPEVAPGFWEPV